MVTLRVRSMVWFATGVVLAVLATVLVMEAWRADAAPGDTDSTFVPTSPCRLFDYRPAPDTVGPRSSPLGAGETHVQQVTGSNGDCTGALAIPSDAVAVAMNVTAVDPTAQSNLRVFPGDVVDVPTISNLNFSAGQKPVPNKVDVKLSPDGKIKLFNFAGSVFVVGDVVGYYTNSTLKEFDQRLANLEAGRPFAVTQRSGGTAVDFTNGTAASLEVTAPADGHFTVNSAGRVTGGASGDEIQCSIAATDATPPEQAADYLQVWSSPSAGQNRSQISGTRSFGVISGQVLPLKLVCSEIGGGSIVIDDVVLTAIFTPAP